MTTERQKIQTYINENLSLLRENSIDVAHSELSDDWFVYEYNKDYHYYEYFIRVTSAEELKTVIEEELRFEAGCRAGEEPSVPDCESDSFAQDIDSFQRYHARISTIIP